MNSYVTLEDHLNLMCHYCANYHHYVGLTWCRMSRCTGGVSTFFFTNLFYYKCLLQPPEKKTTTHRISNFQTKSSNNWNCFCCCFTVELNRNVKHTQQWHSIYNSLNRAFVNCRFKPQWITTKSIQVVNKWFLLLLKCRLRELYCSTK